MVGEIVYTIILQITCKDGEFEFIIDPTIDEFLSEQLLSNEYNFKRELLNEFEFIQLISDVRIQLNFFKFGVLIVFRSLLLTNYCQLSPSTLSEHSWSS